MFSVAGLYYNVKTDIDMRIVDGPLVSYTIQKPFSYIGTILLSSLSLTSLFFFLLRVVPELIGKKKGEHTPPNTAFLRELGFFDELDERHAYPEYNVNDYAAWIDPKKFIPEKPQALSFELPAQEEEPVRVVEPLVQRVKHASAPINLPVASDDVNLPVADIASLPFTFETPVEDVVTPMIEEVPLTTISSHEEFTSAPNRDETVSTIHREPTQEDYKRRLNELLANVK